jgi:hypothetical protein
MFSIITNYKMNVAVGTIKIIKKGAYIKFANSKAYTQYVLNNNCVHCRR